MTDYNSIHYKIRIETDLEDIFIESPKITDIFDAIKYYEELSFNNCQKHFTIFPWDKKNIQFTNFHVYLIVVEEDHEDECRYYDYDIVLLKKELKNDK
jgi:hypothetical protein